jgi:precorrin-2/cobalt-factor-2 C20-methyltransferase
MVAERAPAEVAYDRAATELGRHLTAGRDVAVLCEGDPFFYGSFMYLFARLGVRFAVEVVPGVSSLTACAAALGAPLAGRNDVLAVVPAPLAAEEIAARLERNEAVAIIKLGRHFAKVRGVIEGLELVASARYIEHATMRNQRVLRLAEVDPATVPYFSMILVHRRSQAWT